MLVLFNSSPLQLASLGWVLLLTSKSIPPLSCRLGHVPYDHAFGVLAGGCAPYDRALIRRSHSALLVHYKKVKLKKKLSYIGFELISVNRESDALPPQHPGQSTSLKTNVVYIINCVWAVVCRNVGEVSARIVYTLAFKAP